MSARSLLDTTVLRAALNSDRPPHLIDVRSPAEFAAVHIAGSANVPLELLQEHCADLVDHLDDGLVLVCRSGKRAQQAHKVLVGVGLTNLRVLTGGIVAWEAQGGPVLRGRRRWDLERQIRLIAGTMALVGALGSLLVPGLVWLSVLAGTGLVMAAVTNSCLMGQALSWLPYNHTVTCDVDSVVARLAAHQPTPYRDLTGRS